MENATENAMGPMEQVENEEPILTNPIVFYFLRQNRYCNISQVTLVILVILYPGPRRTPDGPVGPLRSDFYVLQAGRGPWKRSMFIDLVHGPKGSWSCSMEPLSMEMVHGCGPWAWSMDMVHGYGPWIWPIDMVHVNGSWIWSIDIDHRHGPLTCSMDMVRGHCLWRRGPRSRNY